MMMSKGSVICDSALCWLVMLLLILRWSEAREALAPQQEQEEGQGETRLIIFGAPAVLNSSLQQQPVCTITIMQRSDR